MGRPKIDPNDRFNEKVVTRFNDKIKKNENGCTEWTAAKDKDGYGRFQVGGREGKKEYAHIWSYEFHNNTNVKEGNKVCHTCDNPSCIDPNHLFEGTQQENMLDASLKGRMSTSIRDRSAKLSDEEALLVKTSNRPIKELAKDFNLSKVSIYNLRSGKTYKHIT